MKKIFFSTFLFSLAAAFLSADPSAENYVYMSPTSKKWSGFVDVDFLYWKPYSDSLDYAATYLDYVVSLSSRYRNNNDVKHASFSWKPGTRLSAGVSSESWDSKASWTYFESNGKREAFGQNYNPLMPDGLQTVSLFKIWGSGSSDQSYQCDSLTAHYKMTLNNIDLDIGKSFSLSNHWLIRPSLGAKGVCLQQKMHTRATLNGNQNFSRTHITNRYLGAGLRVAAETRFLFNRHFFLFMKGAGSLLDGRFLLKLSDTFTPPAVAPTTIQSENRFDRNAVRTCFELALGGELSWTLNRERSAILFGAAYEIQLWPEQFVLPQLYETVRYVRQAGDVSFHGLVFNASFIY